MSTTTTATAPAIAAGPLPTTTRRRTRSAPLARRAAVATGAALAGNAALLAIGSVGEPIRVVIGSDAAPSALRPVDLALTTVVAIAAGTVALWAARRCRIGDRTWAVGVAVVAVASSVPLWGLAIDSTSKALLTAMHLLTGACCVAARTRRP